MTYQCSPLSSGPRFAPVASGNFPLLLFVNMNIDGMTKLPQALVSRFPPRIKKSLVRCFTAQTVAW